MNPSRLFASHRYGISYLLAPSCRPPFQRLWGSSVGMPHASGVRVGVVSSSGCKHVRQAQLPKPAIPDARRTPHSFTHRPVQVRSLRRQLQPGVSTSLEPVPGPRCGSKQRPLACARTSKTNLDLGKNTRSFRARCGQGPSCFSKNRPPPIHSASGSTEPLMDKSGCSHTSTVHHHRAARAGFFSRRSPL